MIGYVFISIFWLCYEIQLPKRIWFTHTQEGSGPNIYYDLNDYTKVISSKGSRLLGCHYKYPKAVGIKGSCSWSWSRNSQSWDSGGISTKNWIIDFINWKRWYCQTLGLYYCMELALLKIDKGENFRFGDTDWLVA